MQTLFDENGVINISDVVLNNPAYKTIMADGIVTDQELDDQMQRTVAALKKVSELCTPEQQNAVVDALTELSVFQMVFHSYELQNLK